MSTVLVTGSAGLIGSEAVRHFHELGWDVVGVDNDTRGDLFGEEASTRWMAKRLCERLPRYDHLDADIRDEDAMDRLFAERAADLEVVIHTAAQPSHDWAAGNPMKDFTINAQGTLVLLEALRRHSPEAVFIFTSTNKVYGDRPNQLPYVEKKTRWELPRDHEWFEGIPESMSIDQSKHSLFGVSKASADLLVQEYGRYFGLNTVTFRGGCLTGPDHSGTQLHGFLAYLMRCTVTGTSYSVFGHRGKQVRDNIHSRDLVRAFEHVAGSATPGSVYNIGGGRESNCSMLEAIDLCEQIAGKKLDWSYEEEHRVGDHIWWISDLSSFKADYPEWTLEYDVPAILREIHDQNRERWLEFAGAASGR